MHPFMLDALARDRMQARSRTAARMRRPNRFAAVFTRVFGRIAVPTAFPAPTPRPALLPVPVEVGWARSAPATAGSARGRAPGAAPTATATRARARAADRGEGRAAVSRADAGQRFRRSVVLAAGVVLGVLLVGLRRHDVELRVELDVDLVPVVERHLDLVLALFVTVLGPGHAALAGVRERGGTGLVERGAGDRMIAATVAHATRDGHARARSQQTRSLRRLRRSISSWSSLVTPPVDVRTSGSVAGDR